MEKELGQRIKQLRQNKELTLRELGEKAKLSVSYLSLVERGLTSISLSSLQNIALALGVNTTTIFREMQSTDSRVIRSYNNPTFRLNGDFEIWQSLAGRITPELRDMEPVLITLLPGIEREDVVPYSHTGEEFGYVLEGMLTVMVEDKTYDLNPGDSLHLPSQIPHNWANFSNKLVKILMVTTPQ